MYSPEYCSSRGILADVAVLAQPPRRILVSAAAAEVVKVASPAGSADWDPKVAPYMIEPMDALRSRRIEAVVFVGPARTGKTQALVDCWAAYAAVCDPGDMLIYFPTETNALDYSKRRLRRMHENSPALADRLSPRAHDNNLRMIIYRHGAILTLSWPTSSQLAQRDARYIALSDYDSMPDDVNGEGSPFDLGKKRIQAMMSAGMAMVESSPKREVIASEWAPKSAHEAPPTAGGILPLYNRGDRRRWYWHCLHCGAEFEAPALPDYDPLDDIEAAARSARVVCPHCDGVHAPTDKRALQDTGHWVADPGAQGSTIASFWVRGCAAAFQSWASLVRNYLQAVRTYEQTGTEEALRTTYNVDQGLPYRPKTLQADRSIESLHSRAEFWPIRTVPEGVRYLHAAVDVQAARFVVQVVGRGPNNERWLIDRFQITESPGRRDLDGRPKPLDPAAYLEDWQALADLPNRTYPLADGSGRVMRVRAVACDSGGRGSGGNAKAAAGDSSVTQRAYDFWRSMRRANLGERFRLIKGHPGGDGKPAVWRTFPDSKRGDRSANAQGDIPIHWVNTLALKDALDLDLKRAEVGPGYIHFPDWLEDDFFAELCAEVRGPRGWAKARHNEAWDLLVYETALDQIGAWVMGNWKSPRAINWDNPPPWAREWDGNSLVAMPDSGPPPATPHGAPQARAPAPAAPVATPRAPAPRAAPRRGGGHGFGNPDWSL